MVVIVWIMICWFCIRQAVYVLYALYLMIPEMMTAASTEVAQFVKATINASLSQLLVTGL